MAQRKTAARLAASIGRKGLKKSVAGKRSSVSHAALVSAAPADDLVPVEIQREKGLGPDCDPTYFASLDALIEQRCGPVAGAFKVVSG